MKKKIIFVTEALWIGGIETALTNLLKSLDYEKYDVTCLILRNHQDMAPRLPVQVRLLVADRHEAVSFREPYRFARLHHLTEKSTNPSRLHEAMMWAVPVIKWVENRLYIRYIRKNLKAEHFDTCVIYSDRTAEAAVRGIRAEKYLMFYHHGAMRREYHDEIGYRRCSHIVTVSEFVAEQLREFRPRHAQKVTAIHNVADVAGILQKAEQPKALAFAQDRVNLVSCGRISREKGMDLAVDACKILVDRGYNKIHWWIVGGGPEERQLRQQIDRLGLGDHMTVTGMQKNPHPYIGAADLYVQPSRFEGYPMTVLEALILGRVVISTDNGGVGEMVEKGKTGLLCPISAEGIADAVQKLLEDPALLEQLRRNVAALDMEAENQKNLSRLEELF